MSERVRITVLGPPQAWQRARPIVTAEGVKMRVPVATRRYKKLVRDVVGLSRPPDWPLKRRYVVHLRIVVPDHRRRDLDNIEKCVLDALNGVLWADDSQVDEVHKRREIDALRPRLEIVVIALPSVHVDI